MFKVTKNASGEWSLEGSKSAILTLFGILIPISLFAGMAIAAGAMLGVKFILNLAFGVFSYDFLLSVVLTAILLICSFIGWLNHGSESALER